MRVFFILSSPFETRPSPKLGFASPPSPDFG
jgi:hypothetical protein